MPTKPLTRSQWRKEVFRLNKAENGGKNICAQKGKDNHICSKSLVADHINNDSADNRIENGQVICRAYNNKKNPPRILTYLRTGELTLSKTHGHTETLKAVTVSMQRNIDGKPKVIKWLADKLSKTPAIVYDKKFLLSAAKIGDVTKGTVQEWIEIEASDEGDYRIREREIISDKKKVTILLIMTKQNAKIFDEDNNRF